MSNDNMLDIGLMNIVDKPTHLGHNLDRIYCSESVYVNTKVIQSSLFTKHYAVVVSASSACIADLNRASETTHFRK